MSKETEQAELKAWITNEKVMFFTNIDHFLNGGMKLEHAGYKSLEHAVTRMHASCKKAIELRITAFERKYP